MDNNTKKYKVYNSVIINAIKVVYDVDQSFIYRALKSERSSEKAMLVKRDYNKLQNLISPLVAQQDEDISKIIEDFINAENANS